MRRTSAGVPDLFDIKLRAIRRDRAARARGELFLHERAFEDCIERLALTKRRFERALLVGCPDASWTERLRPVVNAIDARDPGKLYAAAAGGTTIVEDRWDAPAAIYDLVLAIGTLDTVNDLRLALQLVRHSIDDGGLFIGALSGGETVPQLRAAMRAADAASKAASPHVHPRIEASALAALLSDVGFDAPVVDVDRVQVSYPSFERLIEDLRAMASTNMLLDRPRFLGRKAADAAAAAFEAAGDRHRTTEIFEILHFAAWVRGDG